MRAILAYAALIGAGSAAMADDSDLARDNVALAKLVRDSKGKFDRFLNSHLMSSLDDMALFEDVAATGRAFQQMLASRNFWGTINDGGPVMPFHEFPVYMKTKPRIFADDWLSTVAAGRDARFVARTERVAVKQLLRSIVISQGDVDVRECVESIFIAGGNVRIMGAGRSMIIAAGDVTLGNGSGGSLIVAGGKVTLGGWRQGLFIISPHKLQFKQKDAGPGGPLIVYDAKPTPAGGLFRFQTLADYGLEAAWDEGCARITTINANSPFRKHLREGDRVAKAQKKKADSMGQFRRLISHFAQTGQLDMEVERDGKVVVVHGPLGTKD